MPDLLHYTEQPAGTILWVHFENEGGILGKVLRVLTGSRFTHCYVSLDKVAIDCEPKTGVVLKDRLWPSPRGRSLFFMVTSEKAFELRQSLRMIPQGLPYERLRTMWWWILRKGRPPVNCVTVSAWVLRKAGIKTPVLGTPSELHEFLTRHKEVSIEQTRRPIRGKQAPKA